MNNQMKRQKREQERERERKEREERASLKLSSRKQASFSHNVLLLIKPFFSVQSRNRGMKSVSLKRSQLNYRRARRHTSTHRQISSINIHPEHFSSNRPISGLLRSCNTGACDMQKANTGTSANTHRSPHLSRCFLSMSVRACDIFLSCVKSCQNVILAP
uniref:Uncharacterized protein n=1 Tax=Anguilla anguilla TaxID=7936 RepID=A0A0E9WVW4_ANGAN